MDTPKAVVVLIEVFRFGIAAAILDEGLPSKTSLLPTAATLDDILWRLSVLEAKETEKGDRIKVLENEIFQLKQKSEQDKMTILQMNREIKQRECLCQDLKTAIRTNLAENKNIEKQEYMAQDESEANEEIPDDHLDVEAERDGSSTTNERQPIKEWSKKRDKRLELDHPVAFFATVTPHDVLHLGANKPIIFDNVVVNVGNAYHPYHGVFTAPYNGVYSFTATVFGRLSGALEYFSISKGDVRYANFEAYDRQQVTQTVILNLQSGEDVSIRNWSSDRGIVGHNYTTFSGFLLYEHFQSQIVG